MLHKDDFEEFLRDEINFDYLRETDYKSPPSTSFKSRCEYCNVNITDRKLRRFCSRECLYQHLADKQRLERVLGICSGCGISMELKVTDDKKYCSTDCFKKRTNVYKPTPQHRKTISETRKRDWAAGDVYLNPAGGRCRWYTHTTNSGVEVRVQGTWELEFVRWLDANQMNYKCHEGSVWYTLNSEDHIYLPDFYVEEWNCFVDIKNEYLYESTKEKINAIVAVLPTLRILRKKDLLSLGIEIK